MKNSIQQETKDMNTIRNPIVMKYINHCFR